MDSSNKTSISIHTPHTGRDYTVGIQKVLTVRFQSTRPIRGATSPCLCSRCSCQHFNPHAPYGARRDCGYQFRTAYGISIHTPHTGRDDTMCQSTLPLSEFQSTRPIRGATFFQSPYYRGYSISIHTPHTGRDVQKTLACFVQDTFQSTRPIRGATAKMHNLCSAFLQQQTIKA